MLIALAHNTRLSLSTGWLLLLAGITLLLQHCQSIHLEAVLVPQYKFRGNNATLLCKYELEPNEELFSLKWYKEETEFYRYTPPDPLTQAPPMHDYGQYGNNRNQQQQQQQLTQKQYNQEAGQVLTWKVPGIKIDEQLSRPQRVVLKRVGFKSTGMYRCEVTAVVKQRGGYGYHGIQGFVMKESINRMTVVELPKTLPTITGGDLKKNYKPADLLNLTCTSDPSNPPATLQWTVNDQKVDPLDTVRQHLIDRKRGLYSSSIGLLMTLKEKHFRHGELRVKCRGTIEAEFWKRDVENVFTDKDRILKVLEVRESQWPDSASSRVVSSTILPVVCAAITTTIILMLPKLMY